MVDCMVLPVSAHPKILDGIPYVKCQPASMARDMGVWKVMYSLLCKDPAHFLILPAHLARCTSAHNHQDTILL